MQNVVFPNLIAAAGSPRERVKAETKSVRVPSICAQAAGSYRPGCQCKLYKTDFEIFLRMPGLDCFSCQHELKQEEDS